MKTTNKLYETRAVVVYDTDATTFNELQDIAAEVNGYIAVLKKKYGEKFYKLSDLRWAPLYDEDDNEVLTFHDDACCTTYKLGILIDK